MKLNSIKKFYSLFTDCKVELYRIVLQIHLCSLALILLSPVNGLAAGGEPLLSCFLEAAQEIIPETPHRVSYIQQEILLSGHARKIIKDLEKDFEKNAIFPDYRDQQQFLKGVSALGAKARKTIALLKNEQVELAIRAPEVNRLLITKTGFKNRHIVNISRGAGDEEVRNKIESKLLKMDLAKYISLDGDIKPKYGYLRPKNDDDLYQEINLSSYGTDIYVFKMNKLRDRTTWTPGDSIDVKMKINENERTWDSQFIPWANRELISPWIVPSENSSGKVRLAAADVTVTSLLHDRFKVSSRGNTYIELQYWGPLTLNDVEYFEFTKVNNAPSGEFLEQLLKYNITIIDGTDPLHKKHWQP